MLFLRLVFVVLPALLGLGMLLAASRARSRQADSPLSERGLQAVGTVVDNRQILEAGSRNDPAAAPVGWYLPVVEFTTESGRLVRAVGDQAARRAYRLSTPIAVRYDPSRPQQVSVGADRARLLTVGGLVALAIAAGLAVLLLTLG